MFCPSTTLPALTLVHESAVRGYILTSYDNKPLFFGVNLNGGTVVGSTYKLDLAESGVEVVMMSLNEAEGIIYIAVRHNNGFHLFQYLPATSTFGTTLKSTTLEIHFVKMMNGYVYFGGIVKSNQNAFIANIAGEQNYDQNTIFDLTSTSDTFTTVGPYSIGFDLLAILLPLGLTASTPSSISPVNQGSYVQATINIFSSDVVYRGGLVETYYIKENYIGQIDFNTPCTLSGTTTVTSSIIAHPDTGTFPAWISLNSDNEHIDVTAPAFGVSNDYYFVLRIVVDGLISNKYVTLTIFD